MIGALQAGLYGESVVQLAAHYVRWFFFFFQAEDGIRDVAVTGVQTCALPIFDENVKRKAVALKEAVQTLYSAASCGVRFITAKELLGLFNQPPSKTLMLHNANLRSEEHTSELQSRPHLVCRLLLEKKRHEIGDARATERMGESRRPPREPGIR